MGSCCQGVPCLSKSGDPPGISLWKTLVWKMFGDKSAIRSVSKSQMWKNGSRPWSFDYANGSLRSREDMTLGLETCALEFRATTL